MYDGRLRISDGGFELVFDVRFPLFLSFSEEGYYFLFLFLLFMGALNEVFRSLFLEFLEEHCVFKVTVFICQTALVLLRR